MPHLHVNESTLYYELSGKGHPLVLIGGLASDVPFWYPVLPALARHFQVLLFERGFEAPLIPPSSIDALAEEVLQLCEKLSLKKPHLLGHSMGGCIAQSLAYRYRSCFSSIILCNSFLKLNPVAQWQLSFQLHLLEKGAPKELFLESLAPWLFSNAFLANREKMERIRAARLEKIPSCDHYKAQLQALFHFDSTAWFYHIEPPLLVIHGMEDILTPHDSEKIAKEIPGTQFISFPDIAHLPMIEEPEEFANVVVRFLTHHPTFFPETATCNSTP